MLAFPGSRIHEVSRRAQVVKCSCIASGYFGSLFQDRVERLHQ